jgi:hypothetical protein
MFAMQILQRYWLKVTYEREGRERCIMNLNCNKELSKFVCNPLTILFYSYKYKYLFSTPKLIGSNNKQKIATTTTSSPPLTLYFLPNLVDLLVGAGSALTFFVAVRPSLFAGFFSSSSSDSSFSSFSSTFFPLPLFADFFSSSSTFLPLAGALAGCLRVRVERRRESSSSFSDLDFSDSDSFSDFSDSDSTFLPFAVRVDLRAGAACFIRLVFSPLSFSLLFSSLPLLSLSPLL